MPLPCIKSGPAGNTHTANVMAVYLLTSNERAPPSLPSLPSCRRPARFSPPLPPITDAWDALRRSMLLPPWCPDAAAPSDDPWASVGLPDFQAPPHNAEDTWRAGRARTDAAARVAARQPAPGACAPLDALLLSEPTAVKLRCAVPAGNLNPNLDSKGLDGGGGRGGGRQIKEKGGASGVVRTPRDREGHQAGARSARATGSRPGSGTGSAAGGAAGAGSSGGGGGGGRPASGAASIVAAGADGVGVGCTPGWATHRSGKSISSWGGGGEGSSSGGGQTQRQRAGTGTLPRGASASGAAGAAGDAAAGANAVVLGGPLIAEGTAAAVGGAGVFLAGSSRPASPGGWQTSRLGSRPASSGYAMARSPRVAGGGGGANVLQL